MKVRDIMTKNVAYVDPNSKVSDVARLMQKHNVGSIPVCDQSGVVGIVTDRDIVVRNIASGKNPSDTPVSEIMTTGVTTVTPDTDVNEIAHVMAAKQIRRVPVVENNTLVGVLSLGDIAVDKRFEVEASEALTEISKPAKPERL